MKEESKLGQSITDTRLSGTWMNLDKGVDVGVGVGVFLCVLRSVAGLDGSVYSIGAIFWDADTMLLTCLGRALPTI